MMHEEPSKAPCPSPSSDRRTLAMLPWGVSVLFHLGLVILAMALIWSRLDQVDVAEDSPITPFITVVDGPPQQLDARRDRDVLDPKADRNATHVPRPTDTSTVMSDISQSTAQAVERSELLTGQDAPALLGVGPADAGGGHRVQWMGVTDHAERIAYVIDASGSMLDTMPFIIRELDRSIQQLNDRQFFTVLFAQADKAIECPPYGMKRAERSTKQHVLRWMDIDSGHVVPGGSANPVAAIKKALQYQPQLVYLLSDNITGRGRYEMDQKRLLKQIRRANTRHTRIHTIQFLYQDPLERIGLEPTLKLISLESGGVYQFIDGRQLGVN